MCKYGKPKESNTEVGEKNHKVFAKQIGRRCRKQHKTFANQVAVRLSDSFVIDKLASSMKLFHEDDNEDCAMVGNAASYNSFWLKKSQIITHATARDKQG
jgi:hypothetical protein